MYTIRHDMLMAALKLSPDGMVQSGFVRIFHNMEYDGKSDKEIATGICKAMLDGLENNNWPSKGETIEP